jgi:hypothetical protein
VKIGIIPESLVERAALALGLAPRRPIRMSMGPDLALHMGRKPGCTEMWLRRMSGVYDTRVNALLEIRGNSTGDVRKIGEIGVRAFFPQPSTN